MMNTQCLNSYTVCRYWFASTCNNFKMESFLCPENLVRMGLWWTVALVWSYFKLFWKNIVGTLKSYPRLQPDPRSSPVCIVTGASSGLGRATAKNLAMQGYHVILAGRSLQCLSEAVEEIKQQHEGVSLKALELDLCSLGSMLKFRDSVESWLKAADLPPSVQLLINNAGILATRQRFTSNGYDSMISSNYLGTFMLTQLLLPLLQCSTKPSRIVNVTSFTHRCVRDIEINEAKLAKGTMQGSSIWNCYRLACNYESSKLFLMLFTYELHRLLYLGNPSHPISIMAADPGVVETRILREVPPWLSWLIFKALKFICLLQSPREGARAIVDAALAPMEVSGQYFFGGRGRTLESSRLSYDQALAQRLWRCSTALFNMAQ